MDEDVNARTIVRGQHHFLAVDPSILEGHLDQAIGALTPANPVVFKTGFLRRIAEVMEGQTIGPQDAHVTVQDCHITRQGIKNPSGLVCREMVHGAPTRWCFTLMSFHTSENGGHGGPSPP